MTEANLKSCPFCGEQDVFNARSPVGVAIPNVACLNCGTRGPVPKRRLGKAPGDEEAAEAVRLWNTRSRPPLPGIEGLVEQLRGEARKAGRPFGPIITKAADAIESLAASREEMRVALEPFARLAGPINGENGRPTYLESIEGKNGTGELCLMSNFSTTGEFMYAADFRRARKAYLGEEGA